MDPVVHFEMPYADAGRVAAFYKAAFGWEMTALGEAMGHYVLATTAKSDAKPGAPAGAINGGFFPREQNPAAPHPTVVIAVSDIRAAIDRVTRAGGTVSGEPMEIPDIGLYVSFVDTEGNRNSMLQPAGPM